MIIRNKQTGEIKYIADNEAQNYGVTQNPVVDRSSVLEKIIGFFSPSTKATMQDISASGQVKDYIKKMEGTGSAVDIAKQLRQAKLSGNTELVESLLQKSKQTQNQVTQQPIFSESTYKHQNDKNPYLSYLDRSLATAGELAPLIAGMSPGFVGAKLGGAGAGLASGIVSGLTREDKTAGQRLGGAAIQGATGWATGKLFDKLFGGGVKKTGENIRQTISKPKVSASPFGAEEETKIAQGLQKMGFKGSAQNQYKQLGGKMTEISGKIDDILSTSKGKIKLADITSKIDESLNNMINFDTSIPGYQNAKDKFINQIITEANKGKNGLTLTGQSLFKVKQNLGNQLKNAFTKLAKGNPLTPSEETGMTIWKTLDDLIKKAEPSVKDLTTLQSILYKASPGLKASSNKPGGLKLPLFGQVGGASIQGSKDILGRLLASAPSNKNIAPALTPLLQNILTTPRDNFNPATTQPMPTTLTGGQPIVTPPKAGILSEDQYKQLAMADVQMTGGKNLAMLKQLYEIGTPKTSAADQKRKTALDSAEGVYNQVYNLAMSAPTGWAGAGKAFLGKLPGVEGGSAEDLQRVNYGLAKAIAGALAGEVGVATDKDIERWLGLMPKVTDTMAERQRALSRLKMAIDNGRQQLLGNTSDGTDTLQSLLGL
jgi:hypothetical protein